MQSPHTHMLLVCALDLTLTLCSVLQFSKAFKGLPQDRLEEAFDRFAREEFRQGQQIVKEGEPVSKMYIVKMGELACTRAGQPVTAIQEAGGFSYFGEQAVLVCLFRCLGVILHANRPCHNYSMQHVFPPSVLGARKQASQQLMAKIRHMGLLMMLFLPRNACPHKPCCGRPVSPAQSQSQCKATISCCWEPVQKSCSSSWFCANDVVFAV